MLKQRKGKRKIGMAIACLGTASLCCLMGAGFSSASANVMRAGSNEGRTPADLWVLGRGLTAEANVASPTYATQGFYVDGYKDGKRLLKYRAVEDTPVEHMTGVKVTSTSEREVAQFCNVIDVEGSQKEENLLTVFPLSSSPTKRTDFNGMKVYFKDAEDESVYVCVDIYVYADTGITMFNVSTSDGAKGAYQYGIYHENFRNFYECSEKYFYNGFMLGGVTNLTQWAPEWNYVMEDPQRQLEGAVPQSEMYLKPIALSYDEADKSVWLNNGASCLFDLDDEQNIPVAQRFKGFPSNNINISVLTYDILGENAQYMLYGVDGQGMHGESIADSTAPYFVDPLSKENLPMAGVNKAYKLFDIRAYDTVDGEITPKVYVKMETENDEAFTLVEGDSFTPTAKGNYVLRYVAEDSFGNATYTDYVVWANYAVPEIDVQIEEDFVENCTVGERLYLPEWTATGGSGTLEKEVEIIRLADNQKISFEGEYFVPLVAGEYVFQFKATDYLGNVRAVVERCTAILSDVPVFEKEFTMYKKFVSGVAVELPKPVAYDYSLVGQKVNAQTKITVTGQGAFASVSEEVQNGQFTPTKEKFGDKVTVSYQISKQGDTTNVLTKSYDVEIIEPKNSWEYLDYDEAAFDLTYNTKDEKDTYVKFTAKQAGSSPIEMINPVKFEYFEFECNTTQSEYFYDGLQLCFTDATDVTNVAVVTLKDRKGDFGTLVEYNGQTAVAVNKFASTEKFVLTVKEGVLCDSLGNALVRFDGFAPEKVRVSITMENAKIGGAISLKKIGSTYFSASYRKGELTNFRDYVAPQIVLDGKIPTEQSYDSYVRVPAAKGYDDLSPWVTVSVTVTSPSGQTLINGESADKAFGFMANEYGAYVLSYTSRDANNNTTTLNYEVGVNDYNPPIFDYNGKTEFTAKLNDSIKLSKYGVYDSVDANPTYFVYMITPNGVMHDVTDLTKYTFTAKGKHILRHYAYDASYNYRLLDITFEVK